MAIGRIRKATRHIARYREIFSTLVRYGLADWASRVDYELAKDLLQRQAPPELLSLSTPERIRRALMELGPTFIKFGQVLSVRPDLVGVALADELKLLQTSVTPDPPFEVERIIEAGLGKPLREIFSSFEPEPVASASIGQVHRAWLLTGEKVAVKVRHRDIVQMVNTDVEILADLAGLVEDYVEESRNYRPRETVAQFARTIKREMDFNREARNIRNLAEDLAGEEGLKIPAVYEDLCDSAVLVMEWMDGTPLTRVGELNLSPDETRDIARRGASLYLKMIFVNGYYHADPHPGNILVLPDGSLTLLDFGMMGRLSTRMREYVEDLAGAIISRDSERITRVIVKAGETPQNLDETALGLDMTEFIAYYGSMPLSKIRLFEALNEMVGVIHRHHITLQAEIMMLIKTLVTLDGTARSLAADFNVLSLISPYHERLGGAGAYLRRRLTRASRFYDEIAVFADTAPPALADIIERLRRGTFEVHMEHRGLEHSANRLVFGILTAALFVGSALLLSFKVPPTLLGLSVLGLLGFAGSLFMGVRILWAIMVSGRLE
ncbi:MAG: AarF/ABC1/UbiB kinase family protein [Nitrospinae bacterium]|nr:AarF/ABC1/UbiB kinase family protein [Nitrospinota bacterium]